MADLETDPDRPCTSPEEELARLRARVAELEARLDRQGNPAHPTFQVAGVPLNWDVARGTFEFLGLRGVMMWLDTTMASLLSALQAMVGPERFNLCLQGQGRKGVEADLAFLDAFPSFEEGFAAYADAFAAAGWGRWEIESLDREARVGRFRIWDSWEGRSQAALGVSWGSAILAGKLAGLCSHLFGTPCWAEQTSFLARGDACDAYLVTPSSRSLESEMERLLESDEATRADMAVALQALRQEVAERTRAQEALSRAGEELELRVAARTSELARANLQLQLEVGERRRLEEQFRRVAESLPIPLALVALPELRALYLNPAFQAVTGLSAENALGLEEWLEAAYPDAREREAARRRTLEFQARGAGNSRHETRIRTRTGEDRDVAVRLVSLGSDRLLVLAEDLTDHKRAERERERLLEQLHRAQKMEALGLLAGGVAHDLNNILSGLVTCPDVVLDSLPEDSPLRAPVLVIQQAGLRAAEVVEDLVTLARGVATPREPCNLNRFVEVYLGSPEFQEATRSRPGVKVQAHLRTDLFQVKASPAGLRKSLSNLVLNAMEALEGPGNVRVETDNRYVDTPLPGYDDVAIGEYVVLSVEDDGPGIPAQTLGRIFEPFFTTKVMGRSGTGLGLTVVWNTVQDHHGYLQVSSEPGRTRFDLYFPATRASSHGSASSADSTVTRGRGERVLVVDDEASQREIACQLLRSLGYQAEAAASGEEAIHRLQQEPFDLVVLDMIMPRGLDGRATYEGLLAVRPGQRALLASGYAETEEVRQTQRMGAGAFLRKPYRAGTLGQAVRRELDEGAGLRPAGGPRFPASEAR